MKKNHDWAHCPGSICEGDTTPNWQENVLWYPGEPVCVSRPYTHAQKVQFRLNKLLMKGKLKNPYGYWTWKMLNNRRAITARTVGYNPDKVGTFHKRRGDARKQNKRQSTTVN